VYRRTTGTLDLCPTTGHGRRITLATAVHLILASAAANAQTTSGGSGPNSGGESAALQEVLVTAQRRTESVQDIPYNISVVSGDQLRESGADVASDLANIVPGLLTVDSGPSARGNTNSFALRGIRTDNPGSLDLPQQTVSPVSTYFGETPLFVPLVLRDLERVEVLRGPQGTLYGSGAEAGTIRFLPNRPDFEHFSAQLQASGSATQHGGSLNSGVDAIVNIPLGEQLALRMVGGEEHLAGFIDDVGLAERQGSGLLAPPVPRVAGDPTSGFVIAPPLRSANSSDQSYGRASLRWAPAPKLDFELTYLHQKTDVADAQFSNPNWSGGVQNLASGYTGPVPPFANASYTVPSGSDYRATALIQQPYDNTVDLGSLVASVDLGLATFTSATSAYQSATDGTDDNTYQWYIPGGTNFLTYYSNYPRTIAIEQDTVKQHSFVQELRLVSNGTHTLDYVVGAYYERQTGRTIQHQWFPGIRDYYTAIGVAGANPQLGDLSLYSDMGTTFNDRAVFGEVTWHVTPAWQLTAGGRYFSQSFNVDFYEELPFCATVCGDALGGFNVHNSESVSNHLVKLNTSYDLTNRLKAYVTYAEGFRRGGATGLPPVGIYASLPQYFTYRPDFAKNYEIGIKGALPSPRLQYTVDVFVIDLKDFQFNSFSPSGLPGVFNGSKARSKGAELELNAQLTNRFSTSIGYSYTDASVTQATNIYDLPAFSGPGGTPILNIAIPEGTRLPGVPKNVVSASLDYRMPLHVPGSSMNWHIDAVHHGSAPGAIPGVYVSGWTLDSATILNARITLDNGKQWSVDVFGTNLTSDTAYSGAIGVQGLPENTLHYRNVTRPRTLGLAARFRF
jgi:iron complex outermembrane recepter protein